MLLAATDQPFQTYWGIHSLPLGFARCEIDAWLNKNIGHDTYWSTVSLYPSPRFLLKNQLAKGGPDSVAIVVIQALALTLDKSLKADWFLCQVRATIWTGPQTEQENGLCLLQERL